MRVNRKIWNIAVALISLISICCGFAQLGRVNADNLPIPRTASIENGSPTWNATWGTPYYDTPMAIATDGHSLFVVGHVSDGPLGMEDIVLSKFSSTGELQDNVFWGGLFNDVAYDIGVDANGSIYVVGTTTSSGMGPFTILVIKFAADFSVCWNVTWGGLVSDSAYGIAVTPDGMVCVTGYTRSYSTTREVVILKYSNSGHLLWNTTFTGPDVDEGHGICLGPDRSVYIAGDTQSWQAGGGDLLVLKYDQNGIFQWNQSWRTTESEIGRSIAVDPDGNVVIGGLTAGQFFILKYKPDGTLIGNSTWGGSSYDDCNDLIANTDGTYLLAGNTWSFGAGGEDMALVQFSRDLVVTWNTTWGGPNADTGIGLVRLGDLVCIIGQTTGWITPSEDYLLVAFSIPLFIDWTMIWIVLGVIGIVTAVIVIMVFVRKKSRKVEGKNK